MCLFCYQRLQSEYNNTCPGCRSQYSDDLEGVRQHIARKQQQAKNEPASARGVLAASSHAAGGHHPHHHHAAHTAQHGHTAANRSKVAGIAAKQRAGHADGSQGRGMGLHAAAEAANSSLPPTASWAVPSAPAAAGGADLSQQQQPQQQQEPPPPAAGDESAWPTLGAAQPQQQQQQQPRPDAGQGHQRRRSSSSSLSALPPHQQQRFEACRSSFESTGSTHTAHSERRQQQQQQGTQSSDSDAQSSVSPAEQQEQQLERNSSGFTTVEVSTVVGGKRHDVCVHVSHAEEVTVYPEASSLLEVLQHAVHSSKLSSTEAAVQLVQCLRKLEADSSIDGSKAGHNWLQQVLAAKHSNGATPHSSGRPPVARAPPPGFGPSAAKAANGLSNGTGQQHHELPPAGWSLGHRAQQQQQAAHGETPQGSMHSVDSTNSLFSQGSSLSQSVWIDSGLPGVVDLGLGAARLAGAAGGGGGVLGAGLPAAVPARLQMLWANGSNGTAAGANGLGYSSGAVTGPPPGFGGVAGGLGLTGSRLNGAYYNPLSFANAGTAAQQQDRGGVGGIGLPPGFGLAGLGAATGAKQQQAQQASLYQPF